MLTENQVRFSIIDDIMVVELPSQAITQSDLIELNDQWLDLVDHYHPTRMIVDFNHVTRFSSQAVGTLIRVAQRMRQAEGEIKLCAMSPRIRELFRICRLVPGSFELYSSIGEAAEAFGEDAQLKGIAELQT